MITGILFDYISIFKLDDISGKIFCRNKMCYKNFLYVQFCYRFEKMISGMYMGELVRLVLQKFTKEGLLFGGKGSDMLFERGRFYTKYVSEIETDPPGVFNNLREICEELGKKCILLIFM